MKRATALILTLSLTTITVAQPSMQEAAQKQDQQIASQLTNKDVLEMMKAGLAPEVIVAKVKSTNGNFDTSPAALTELKSAGVPDLVIMAMLSSSTLQPTLTEDAEIKIPDGTGVEIELASAISSKSAKEGEVVDFIAAEPVVINGTTVIEKGARARGVIAVAKKAGRWGKAGKLAWVMQDVAAVNGTKIPVRMERRLSGDSKGGTVATGAIVTGLIFFPAAPLWGFKKGKDSVLAAGKRFVAFINGEVTLKGKEILVKPVANAPSSSAPTTKP
jgi:hypothetical protein